MWGGGRVNDKGCCHVLSEYGRETVELRVWGTRGGRVGQKGGLMKRTKGVRGKSEENRKMER